MATQSPGTRPPYVSEVHLAHGRDSAWLHSRIRELCEPFGTAIEDAGGGRLRIPLQGSSSVRQGGSQAAAGGRAAASGGLVSKLLGMLRT